jgi:hypothetical protein
MRSPAGAVRCSQQSEVFALFNWFGIPFLGSIRRKAAQEVRAHLKANPAIQRVRLPWGLKMLRAFHGQRGPMGFLALYFGLVKFLIVTEIVVAKQLPSAIPDLNQGNDGLETFLKDVTSYYLGAQIVIIGLLFPIAVALVTLIIQREQASSTASDIQVYYEESLAYKIGAIGIALSIVLAAQLLWPAQFTSNRLGFDSQTMFHKILLTAVHLVWLLINFAALWHFLLTSLNFMRPIERTLLRNRFAANVAIPADLLDNLAQYHYFHAGRLVADRQTGRMKKAKPPNLLFGFDLGGSSSTEIVDPSLAKKVLIDVWLWPLSWAIWRWVKRCRESSADVPKGEQELKLAILPTWQQPLPEDGILCQRRNGVPLDRFERFLIRRSLRFAKASI